jgi:hypothetical protein
VLNRGLFQALFGPLFTSDIADPNTGGGFSLDAFMGTQADGFYYDFTKTDRHFQENTGQTIADDVGEVIGLALDQRSWGGKTLAALLAGQAELCVEGNFSNGGAAWTLVTATVSGGALHASNGFQMASQNMGLVVGKTYRVAFDYTRSSGVSIRLNNSSTNGAADLYTTPALGASGTVVAYVRPTTGGVLSFEAAGAAWTGTIDNVSVMLVPGNAAIQATGTLKGVRQSAGCKFDGTDDNLLTAYLAVSGANFIGARTTVPSSLGAAQVILGASGSGTARAFLAIDTSGRACGGVGSQSTTTIVGTTDLRNTEATVFLTWNGTTVRLIVNGAVEYEAAQSGVATTSIPVRLGANNSNGTAGSFYAGTIKHALAGQEFITAGRATQISGQLAA